MYFRVTEWYPVLHYYFLPLRVASETPPTPCPDTRAFHAPSCDAADYWARDYWARARRAQFLRALATSPSSLASVTTRATPRTASGRHGHRARLQDAALVSRTTPSRRPPVLRTTSRHRVILRRRWRRAQARHVAIAADGLRDAARNFSTPRSSCTASMEPRTTLRLTRDYCGASGAVTPSATSKHGSRAQARNFCDVALRQTLRAHPLATLMKVRR